MTSYAVTLLDEIDEVSDGRSRRLIRTSIRSATSRGSRS